MASGLFAAYLAGGARAFFGAHYADAEDRRCAVERAVRPIESSVADAIEAQNARLAPSRARDHHLASLRRGAAAVVTGQQVGLFLGPLYTIYKAASAVRVAKALGAETGAPVVPIFWLQTEDHDLPEISECKVPCASGEPLSLRLPSSSEDRVSIAQRKLPAEVTACLARLRSELAGLPHVEEHLARLERHYCPGHGWAEAFAGLLAELFEAQGLVVIDPRDPFLASAALPVHHRALVAAGAIADGLVTRGRELGIAGFAAAVHVRPGAPLSFFHPQGAAGPRCRLAPASGGFREVGGDRTHMLATLLSVLETDPLSFSTSALLRPVLQDVLLPTAASVCGPGEVAYFAQLAPVYDAFGLPMPLVVPRARFRVVEEKTRRLLARLHLASSDAARPQDELLAAAGAADAEFPDSAEIAATLLPPFVSALAAWQDRSAPRAPGLERAFEKTRATVEMAVSRLGQKVDKARLRRDEGLIEDVRRLQSFLAPGGVPQERVYGLPYFAARYGDRRFVERVLSATRPFDAAEQDLSP